MEVLCVDLTFLCFNVSAQVMQCDLLSVHFDPAPENKAVNIVTFVAYEGERDIGPTLRGSGLVLPLRGAKLEDVVVDVEWEGNVEIVRANRRVWALCLGGFEVEEADLVP